jgi:hypothetical protein
MAGVRNSGEIPVCLLMGDAVDTGSTLVRPVADPKQGSGVVPNLESAGDGRKVFVSGDDDAFKHRTLEL